MSSSAERVARLLAGLQKRIEALERGNHLQMSSVRSADGTPIPVVPALVSASGMLAQALADSVAGAQADGLVDIYYSDTVPEIAAEGDYWMRTYDEQLFKYISGVWVDYNNQALTDALERARHSGDAKIRTFWQADAPLTADTGDLWFETDQANHAHRWSSGAWQSLAFGSSALQEAGVDPSRLTVGITGNLFQDPTFTTAIRTPPIDWQILGPDSVFPGSNYVRCQHSSGDTSTWAWTSAMPIDPGRSVRVACLVRPDALSVTSAIAELKVIFSRSAGSGWSTGTFTDTLKDVFSDSFVDAASITAENVVWVDPSEAGVWSILEGVFDVPEGYSYFQAIVQTRNQTTGNIDFIKPEVQVLWNRVRSSTYVEGVSGWLLDDRNVQVPNMNVLGTLGASEISTETLELDGADLATTLSEMPSGVVSYARSYGTHTANISTTRTITHEFHGGEMISGRMYRISVHGHLEATTTDSSFDVMLVYTTDGTTPVFNSAILDGSLTRVNTGSMGSNSYTIQAYYFPSTDYANTKFSLAMIRAAGTGTGKLFLTDINRTSEFILEDLGVYPAVISNGGGGILSQISKSAGSADATPVTTYTKSWYATWTRSYTGDFDTRPGDTTDLYQGYSSTRAYKNQRSLIGFDYANIQSTLSGATVKSIKVTYKTKRVAGSDGITLYMSSHDYTAKPSTFDVARVNNDRIHWAAQKEGATYTHTLPLAIATELQTGTTRGLGFGPAPGTSFDDYYGYCYGGTTSLSRPKLTITYTK